jgi:hypothetical protein
VKSALVLLSLLVGCAVSDPGPAPQWPPAPGSLVSLRIVASTPACEAQRPVDQEYSLYPYAGLRPVDCSAMVPWDAWADEFAAPVWPAGEERIRIGAPELDGDAWAIPFTFTLESMDGSSCIWPGVVDLLAPEVSL